MDSYRWYSPMAPNSSQFDVQTIDPSKLGGGPQTSAFTGQAPGVLTGLRDESSLASPSGTDYSGSTALSPVTGDFQGYADSAVTSPLEYHSAAHDISLQGKSRQKRTRGRQIGVVKRKKQAAVERQVNAPTSKASVRRAELISMYGAHMIAADDELKGRTRPRTDGFLEWEEPGTGKWLAAAPHDWFRQYFININSADEPYLEPPEKGLHPLDITSNCSILGQNEWTFDRQGWDKIVDGEGNKVMFLEKAPDRFEEFPQAKYLRHEDLVMLDPDDRPVLDWACIPLVFSSKLEGSRMEALKRVFPWLKNADFRARMPRNAQNSTGVLEPLSKYSTFGQRMSRFRDRMRCVPWTDRQGMKDRTKRKVRDLTKDIEDGKVTSRDLASPNFITCGKDRKTKKGDVLADESSFTEKSSKDQQNMAGLEASKSQVKEHTCSVLLAPIHGYSTDQPTPVTSSPWPYEQSATPQFDTSTQAANSPYHQAVEESLPALQPILTDLRFAKPLTTADRANIKSALQVTRADFRSRHAFDAPFTPSSESYYTQYQIIQTKHEELWIMDGSPPPLVGIDAWFGSFETWPTPYLLREELERLLSASDTYNTNLKDQIGIEDGTLATAVKRSNKNTRQARF